MLGRLELSEDSTLQTVRDMAKLSMLTGRISEDQVKNLKMYPLVFFEGVSKATVDFDLSNNMSVEVDQPGKVDLDYKWNASDTKNLRVSYHLTIDESLNSNLDKRFKAIEESVHTIFWKQVRVEVFFNTKLVYESKNV